jgi:hypothetical protein
MSDWIRHKDWEGCENWTKQLDDNSELMILFAKEPHASREGKFWHLSISCRSTKLKNVGGGALGKRIPTFEEVKEARYKFLPFDINVAMMFPPKEHWITLPNSVVLHLWEVPLEMAELKEAGV